MPSPSPKRSVEDLETMQRLKVNFDRLKQMREEFLASVEKYSHEERYLNDVAAEKDDLEREKMILTEEMKAVNCDINKLDDAAKVSETARKSAYESASRSFKAMREAHLAVNADRAILQLELLPDSLVDRELEQKFHCGMIQQHHWNVPPIGVFPLQLNEDYHHRPVDLAMLANVSVGANAAAAAAGAATLESPAVASSSSTTSFGKQQPPPMKTCNSCQQQIHRNAPICPLCKAKSRSRHPKKPKRKADDIS